MVALTLAALATFVAVGAGSADAGDVLERIGPATWRDALGTPTALLHATALLFVAYTGYGRIATLGEEVRTPERTIPRAVVTTLVASMLVYVAVATTALAVVGPETFAAFATESAAPLEQVARRFESPEVAWVVSIGAVSAMAGVLTNLLLGLSRVLLAMARRGDMPSALSVLGRSAQSPRRAVWAVGAGIAALVLIGDLRLTWSFSAFSVLVYYGLTNLAALRLPPAAHRYPRVVALLGLISCSGLAFFVDRSVWIAGLGLLGIGLAGRAVAGGIRTS
jgi:APA family basic amino acid/polyamine antiporter